MTNASSRSRQLLYAAIGLVIAAAPAVAFFAGAGSPAPRLAAECSSSDTEDSFSLNCSPTVIPDTSDQLTEAEVAEPGFNSHPGGGGGGGSH
ncbi:hypothetical protein [Mycolicibacterium sphagni]|uniref:hypothetical protein n=1 Tax=Mycolicibacterium sphagni TaxID=1786 RepID=UPI00105571D7|nr:hypothetical protein [Mycolicibacterium sphagni]MCV7176708.1 hypothetical protein [Mycolicibacterium sphagni]